MKLLCRSFLISSLALLTSASSVQKEARQDGGKPNIIIILTDDQDVHMGSMDYMGGLKQHLQSQGTTYTHHYCTVSLCCPSRVNLWTGKAAHNTNVTDLSPPFGGYPKFVEYGWNQNWLGVWLQNAGYKTYYTGKLMNSHNVKNYNTPPLPGLDGHDYLLEPGTYRYWNPTYQKNDEAPQSYEGQYTTDLLIDKSLDLLDEAANSGSPFFMAIAPVAPHSDATAETSNSTKGENPFPPASAPKYANLFSDAVVPRGANFNPSVPSGGSWVQDLDQLTQENIDFNDEWYRLRLRALQSVDELINKTVAALESYNVLNNTYIIYTTDNGFHISQHRLEPGKRCPYEEDINVPMVVRGPGIPAGATAEMVTSHTDIAPTIAKWAGATAPDNLDGVAIPATDAEATAQNFETAQVEHWGIAPPSGRYIDYKYPIGTNNTYKGLRVIGTDYNMAYIVWCDGSHEMYDMTADQGQMNNLYGQSGQVLGVSIAQLQARLDALLLVLKSCAAQTCRSPWGALHPKGGVSTLRDALDSQYDNFYENQPKVAFQKCAGGYIAAYEQPENYNRFNGKRSRLSKRDMWEYNQWRRYSD